MSTKGTKLAPLTRRKISLSKQQFTKSHLVQAYNRYLDHLNANPKELPTIEGYALTVGCSAATIREYSRKFAEVAAIVDHLQTLQAHALITEGSTNQRNSVFSIFLLKSKHGYTDQPQQLTQNNYMNISPEVMSEALKLMQDKE